MRRDVQRDSKGFIVSYDGVPVTRLSALGKASNPLPRSFYCINLKGANGSGKSTVPIQMIKRDPDVCYLTFDKTDKKPLATYCPTFGVVILGLYLPGTNCGGCDALPNTDTVKLLLSKLWTRPVHILYEGVIVGDIKSTFYEVTKAFAQAIPRVVSFCFMGTKFKECLRRIQKRNGGKEIKTDLVRAKYRNSVTHLKFYLEQGDVDVQVLDTTGSVNAVFNRFCQLYPHVGPPF